MNNPNYPNMMQPQRSGNLHQQLILHYRKQEQNRQLTQGWQQSTAPEERASIAIQFCTAYRLVKPDGEQKEAVQNAISIENSCFLQAQTKDQYASNAKQRLQQLTQMRQQRVQGMQNNLNQGMNPAQMGMMGQQQMPGPQGPRQGLPQQLPPGFPNPQLQRPMQPTALTMTPNQSSMGNNAANGFNFPQGQAPAQPNMQQQPQQQHAVNDQAALTMLARKVMQSSNPEIMAKFRQEVDAWPPERRNQLTTRGIDPLLFRFRQHTEALVKGGKISMNALQQAARAAKEQQQQGQLNQMQNQQMNGNQGQQNQNFDFNAMMNQQNEALRVQEAGQQVVPASNSANANQMGGFPGQNGQQGQAQNAAALAQRQAQAFQQATLQRQQQQARAQQQLQQQQQQQAARNANPLLQAQMNGLNLPPNPQQPNGMAMLNRPVGQAGPGTPQPRPPQAHVPQMQPQGDPQVATQLIREAQQRAVAAGQPLTEQLRLSLLPANMDPQTKQRLLQLPEQQFRAFVANNLHAMRQGNGMPNVQFQGGQATPGPPNMMMNPALQMGLQGQLMNGGNMPNLGRAPGMTPGQQPNPITGPQMMMNQQSGANQAQRLTAARAMLQQNPGIITQTDNTAFPNNVLNPQLKQTLPPDVTTWAQLKQWASQNQALVPSLETNKIVMLQALHFHEMLLRQQTLMPGGPRPPQQNTPGVLAPQAQMTPVPAPNRTPQQQPNLAGLPPPVVTPQELQQTRTRLTPAQQGITDQQLHAFILNQKITQRRNQQTQMKMMEAQGAQQAQLQQQQQQAQLLQQQQQQQQQLQPQPTSVPPASRPQPAASAPVQGPPQARPAAKSQPPKPAEASNSNNLKQGVKRPSEDNAESSLKAQAANVAPQAPAMVPTKSQQAVGNLTEAQLSKLPPDAQARMRAQLLKAQDASNTKPQQRPPPGWQELTNKISQPEVLNKFRALLLDEEQKAPRGQVVQYTPEARARLQELVSSKLPHLRKVEHALRIFHVAYPPDQSESVARDIIRARTALLRNINPQTGKLNDELMLGAEDFANNIKHILSFVGRIMSRFHNQGQGNAAQQGQGQGQGQQQAQPSDNQTQSARQPQLNAANLKIVDQQQRQNKVPQAPTTDRPPFSLGAQSPSGAPKYFEGLRGVTNLHLPDNKKRKLDPSSQASTPVPKASPRIGAGKGGSPELKRGTPTEKAAVEQKPTFKCKTADCDYSVRGFDTPAELEAHIKEAHAKIDDPLQYVIDSMADTLDVDAKTGQPKTSPQTKSSSKAAPVPSRPQQGPIKSGQTPSIAQNAATPAGQAAATPMTRVPTQPGIKSSPSTSLLKTPQTTGKVATPSTGMPTKVTPSSKTAKEMELTVLPKKDEEDEGPAFAPYFLFDSSYEDLYGALDTNMPFNVLDLKDEDTSWLLRENSPLNTPDSSSKDTPSTRTSDISENDNIQINLDVKDLDVPDAWLSALAGDPLPLDAQLSDDIQTLGVMLPPMDNNDMMLFYGDNYLMDIDSIDSKAVEGLTLDPSLLG
jgi:hypothetical protein